MKPKKMIATMFASMLMFVACLTASNSLAQTKTDSAMMKDCCMMKDGKMMCMKDGKTMPMDKNMTMENGTKCMTNGKCKMKDGTKMKMKEGECMDMSGMMSDCGMMMKDSKTETEKTNPNQNMATTYTCPMHPEVMSDKPGKCPKCGMDLVKKK
ncbi:MAG: hypothetical protein LH473_03825 [Chitinophagales bacterium]|nr:hypothetical protein [Chitinophagales bacterium]